MSQQCVGDKDNVYILLNSINSDTVFSRRNDEFWHSSNSTIRQSSSVSTLTFCPFDTSAAAHNSDDSLMESILLLIIS